MPNRGRATKGFDCIFDMDYVLQAPEKAYSATALFNSTQNYAATLRVEMKTFGGLVEVVSKRIYAAKNILDHS